MSTNVTVRVLPGPLGTWAVWPANARLSSLCSSNTSAIEAQNTRARVPAAWASRFQRNGFFQVSALTARRGLLTPQQVPCWAFRLL